MELPGEFFHSHGLWNKFNSKLYLISKLFNIDTPIMKEDFRVKIHLKILYLYFNYDDTFLKKLFFFLSILINFPIKTFEIFMQLKQQRNIYFFQLYILKYCLKDYSIGSFNSSSQSLYNIYLSLLVQ